MARAVTHCGRRRLRRTLATGLVAGLAFVACGRTTSPEEVALAYARAVYATDASTTWRLVSEADRRVKDEETFRRQQRQVAGFAREVVGELARLITATPVRTAVTGDRASVTLKFRLPDGNAPAIRTLLLGWDVDRLATLADSERRRIKDTLGRLHREGGLPMIEGDETVELVREGPGWKVFLNWAGGIAVRFTATVGPETPLEVTLVPASVVLSPGERIRVTARARNTSRQEVTARVGHRIEPRDQAASLALLLCPLFVPVTLKPGQTEEFTSEYLLLADVARDARPFTVTYVFPAVGDDPSRSRPDAR